MDDFPMTITEAYSSTPNTDRGLRDPLARIALNHIDRLRKTKDFVQVLEETVSFSADPIQSLNSQKSTNHSLTKYCCPSRDKQWQVESPAFPTAPYVDTVDPTGTYVFSRSDVIVMKTSTTV